MREIVACVAFLFLAAGMTCYWVSSSSECDAKRGVLVRDALGFPACVSGAK